MNEIGGFFCNEELSENRNNFLKSMCPIDGDLAYLMSGRCGIYYALEDLKLKDDKRIAYLPAYTCETVIAPFLKSGYELMFYDIDKNMKPIFNNELIAKISVILICGYFGFCYYDRNFIKQCSENGVSVIEDTTHSMFSRNGIDSSCDYIVGSLRKWIGIASGGFAIKTHGKFIFSLLDSDKNHIAARNLAMSMKKEYLEHSDSDNFQEATKIFWNAEMNLRKVFNIYKSDEDSIQVAEHFNVQALVERRRANYQYLIDHLKENSNFTLVFPDLDDDSVPSHLTIYSNKRSDLQNYLTSNKIISTIYWPINDSVNLESFPNANYIYNNVLSISCDQRYNEKHMQYICDTLEKFEYNL